jgi:flagellar capping protein FliD
MGSISFLGLSSGTDWNSVIQQLVQVERRPLDIVARNRTQIAYNQSVMSQVHSQLSKFNTQLSNMRFESTFLSRVVQSSNTARVSATVEAGAATGTHSVEISRLAAAGRATSGLEGELYGKVANLSPTQSIGIGGLTPFGEFQPTRALGSTLIRDTQQAGKNGQAITAGDSISISGNLKNGSAVSGTFTFNGNSSDTLQRLATTIAQVFHGEIAGSIGSNGELVFIETDPSVAGDVTFNTTVPALGITFNDNDYSGSALDFGRFPARGPRSAALCTASLSPAAAASN